MRKTVSAELSHIPKGRGPQQELRMAYWNYRMRSLGKKSKENKTAVAVLKECILLLEKGYPDFKFKYDQEFFSGFESSHLWHDTIAWALSESRPS
jgi:hypothetical protein